MKRKRLTFGKATEVTDPRDDSRSFLYPFSMVAADSVGAPDEVQATTDYRLIVRAENRRLIAWRLTEHELVLVLFEIGHRAVAEKVQTGTLARDERVMVHTASHSTNCPFDPSRIREPDGAVFEIDEATRIGFR
jgi:hypothetical protein